MEELKSLLLIFLLSFVTTCVAQDVCVLKTPCSCVFSNGTGIDLSPAVKSTFYTAPMYEVKDNATELILETYYFHPCFDAPLPVNTTDALRCGSPLSICQFKQTLSTINNTTKDTFKIDAGVYSFMGSINYTTFSNDGQSIIYANGPSSTVVMLVCSQTESTLSVFSLEDPNRIVLQFYSRDACLKQLEEPGRSFGSTLLIIFFSLVVFYLGLGVLTRKFLMGATGLEVIPNLPFWSELPNLVRDGWAFMMSGFKLPARSMAPPVTSPDPNSYDSI